MMKHLILLVLVLAGMAMGAEPAKRDDPAKPMPLPTPGELQQMHDMGQYRICLQQIARVMLLRGDAARPYDKYSLFLLRGDCLLQLEDRTTALDAYTAAAKSPEPAQMAEARATELLIRGSAGLFFTPKPPADPTPISIVARADRKKAMLALHKQLLEDSKLQIDAAVDARNLAPIIAAKSTFLDIHSLEVAATGSDAEIHPTLLKVGERARELMTNELNEVDSRVKRVESMANQPIDAVVGGAWWWGGSVRRGLTSDDRDKLRHDGDYTDQISSAAEQFQAISRSLGATGEKWMPVIERAGAVAQHARDVLAAE